MRELVSDDGLQFLPGEPCQAPSVTPITPPPWRSLKANALSPTVRTVTHLDARRTGRDAHLLDDVGETSVVAVAWVERTAVHRREEAVPGADLHEGPVEDRCRERDAEDQQGAAAA